jgi:Ca2+-binding RTX toxin-like protein
LSGGNGADSLDGSAGTDTADYSGESGPVAVNLHSSLFIFPAGHPFASRSLSPGEALDSFGNYDTLAGIENLILTAGNDRVLGSDVANRIEAGAGDDNVSAAEGDDVVLAGAGTDTVAGGGGDDRIEGGTDADTLYGEGGNDSVDGGSGNDLVLGGIGNDTVDGGAGDDILVGEKGDDILRGGDGDDGLVGGSGVDSFDGGANDELINAVSVYGDRVSFGDRIATQAAVADLRTGVIGNDGFGNAETMANIESLGGGTAFADSFYGNDNRNALDGALGDHLFGFGGDDIVTLRAVPGTADGGAGTDLLRLETGNGWLLPDSNGDGLADIAPAATAGWGVDLGNGSIEDGYGNSGTVQGFESVTGSALDDALFGSDGANALDGAAGDDFISGRGGDDGIDGGAGNDVVQGADGNDVLAAGSGNDLLRGGSGVDSFDGGTDDGAFTDGSIGYGDRVSFFDDRATQGAVADLRTGTVANDGFGNAETMSGIESLGDGTAFADVFYGNDSINGLLGGVGDSLYGFGGDDLLQLSSAAAVVDGGSGTDRLQLSSDLVVLLPDSNADGVAEIAAAMTLGWTVSLAGGTLRDGYGNVGTVTAVENLIGSALADQLRGGAGANRIEGGVGNDFLLMQDGGEDSALGGEGNDVVYFGTALSAGDVADGGAGRDAIVLQGNVTAVLSETNLVAIESISIQSGANAFFGDTANNYYDYSVTTANGNVLAGQQLIVNAQSLRAGEDFTFDGSAEHDGKFVVYGGHGTDILKGGDGADVFFFEGARWTAGDRVDGGAGRDSVAISAGSGLNHIEFAADALTNIESISVNNFFATDPSQKPSYELVLNNGNVAAGATLIVNGSSIPGGQLVSIDGRNVQAGNLILLGGGGHDTLTGGAGSDVLIGGEGSDALTGGAGADTFRYDAASTAPDLIGDFQSGTDKIDLSRIDANSNAAGDQAFSWIGSNAFSGTAGELRAVADNGYQRIEGDVNGDGAADLVIFLQIGTPAPVQADFLL